MTMPEETEDIFHGIQESMEAAKKVIERVDKEYGRLFGRSYGGLTQCYRCEDADYIAVAMGAWSGDLMEAVNTLRDQGYRVGVVRIRFYRPFPHEELWRYSGRAKGVIVFDRSISFGGWGPIFTDLVTGLAAYTDKLPALSNIVTGIAGVNITSEDFEKLVKRFVETVEKGGKPVFFEWFKKR